MWIEFLVSADEGVFVDLPDLRVVVPGRDVVGQVLSISRHAGRYLILNLLDVRVLRYHLVDRLSSQRRPHHKLFTHTISSIISGSNASLGAR